MTRAPKLDLERLLGKLNITLIIIVCLRERMNWQVVV